MSLRHANSGEAINIRPLGEKLKESVSTALLKTSELEVLRLVLAAGKSMPEHHVPGEVTVQCLEGLIELHAHQKKQILRAGEMAYLTGDEPHSMHALEDASLLYTILLKH